MTPPFPHWLLTRVLTVALIIGSALILSACSGIPPATPAPIETSSTSSPAASPLEPEIAPRVGHRAPPIELQTPAGESISLEQLRGKTVVVNFWAIWCEPCRRELPTLQQIAAEGANVVVLGVNQGDSPERIQEYLAELGVSFPVAVDRDLAVGTKYLVRGLPTTYFIDRDGIIRQRYIGEMTAEQIIERIRLTQDAASGDIPGPASLQAEAGEAADRLAVEVGQSRLTHRDVLRRLDLALALERLRTGAIYDPQKQADDIAQRQELILQQLIEEELLIQAAQRAGLAVDAATVDQEVEYIAATYGGLEAVRSVLREHGVEVEDLRAATERDLLAQRFVDQHILTATATGSPEAVIDRWLVEERARAGVRRPLP